jgi:hypothetical protein
MDEPLLKALEQPSFRSLTSNQQADILKVSASGLRRAKRRLIRQRRLREGVARSEQTDAAIIEYVKYHGGHMTSLSAVARGVRMSRDHVGNRARALAAQGKLEIRRDPNARGWAKFYMTVPHTNHLGKWHKGQFRGRSFMVASSDRQQSTRARRRRFLCPNLSQNWTTLVPPHPFRVCEGHAVRHRPLTWPGIYCLRRQPHAGCGQPGHPDWSPGSLTARRPSRTRRSERGSARARHPGDMTHGTPLFAVDQRGGGAAAELAIASCRATVDAMSTKRPVARRSSHPPRFVADPGRQQAVAEAARRHAAADRSRP